MHKCIMVKAGGGITRKACKTLMNFPKTEGEICESRGGNNNFRESNKQNRREIQNAWSMTKKKVIRNFGGWKSENFVGKGKISQTFHRVKNIFENKRKESETGGKCIMASGGMDAPGNDKKNFYMIIRYV